MSRRNFGGWESKVRGTCYVARAGLGSRVLAGTAVLWHLTAPCGRAEPPDAPGPDDPVARQVQGLRAEYEASRPFREREYRVARAEMGERLAKPGMTLARAVATFADDHQDRSAAQLQAVHDLVRERLTADPFEASGHRAVELSHQLRALWFFETNRRGHDGLGDRLQRSRLNLSNDYWRALHGLKALDRELTTRAVRDALPLAPNHPETYVAAKWAQFQAHGRDFAGTTENSLDLYRAVREAAEEYAARYRRPTADFYRTLFSGEMSTSLPAVFIDCLEAAATHIVLDASISPESRVVLLDRLRRADPHWLVRNGTSYQRVRHAPGFERYRHGVDEWERQIVARQLIAMRIGMTFHLHPELVQAPVVRALEKDFFTSLQPFYPPMPKRTWCSAVTELFGFGGG